MGDQPGTEETNAQQEFSATEISQDEFESIWWQAVQRR
jgi:hypothetical protein